MSGKSDDEIQKAVFQAYEIQLKVISEYSGHVLDPEFPYGYFKDEMPISNTRTSNPQSDLIFYNNAIRGFIGQNKNSVTIKWASDQVSCKINIEKIKSNFIIFITNLMFSLIVTMSHCNHTLLKIAFYVFIF